MSENEKVYIELHDEIVMWKVIVEKQKKENKVLKAEVERLKKENENLNEVLNEVSEW